MKSIWICLPVLAFLASCASNPTANSGAEIANKRFAEQLLPMRVKAKDVEGGGSVMTYYWAGTMGESVATPVVEKDIYKMININCDYNPEDLKQVNIVRHQYPMFYEVWVFNDKESRREDKTSALSVILKALPNNGGTDINTIGSCHA